MLKKVILSLLVLTTYSASSSSKELGQHGAVFEIVEESLIDVIQKRLRQLQVEGKIGDLQKDLQQKARAMIERPTPVKGITKARKQKSYLYDPTFVSTQDITDQEGKLIVKKGTSFNPLDKMSFGDPLIFIDGDDPSQVQWSIVQKGKIILVKGAPLALSRIHNRSFYFDQGSVLTEKFGITEVPTQVIQQGKHLLIESFDISNSKFG